MFTRQTQRATKVRMFIVMAAALALGLLTGNAMAQTGILQGTVTDAGTGIPIDHALVVARGAMGGPGGERDTEEVIRRAAAGTTRHDTRSPMQPAPTCSATCRPATTVSPAASPATSWPAPT